MQLFEFQDELTSCFWGTSFLLERAMCVCAQLLSFVCLFETLWVGAHQVPLSMEFSRQEYSSGLPCPSPGALPDPGIEPTSPVFLALEADSLPSEPTGKSPRTEKLFRLEYLADIFLNEQ